MLVMARVVDRQANLMKLRGPRERVRRVLGAQVPIVDDLAEQSERRGLDTIGVRLVDGVALRKHRDRAVTRVLVLEATQHVVEQAFAKRSR